MYIMNTFTVTATELKTNPSHIINRVMYEKKTAIVKRHGKTVLEMIPKSDITSDTFNVHAALKKSFGSIPDFPDVTKFRTSNSRRFKTIA